APAVDAGPGPAVAGAGVRLLRAGGGQPGCASGAVGRVEPGPADAAARRYAAPRSAVATGGMALAARGDADAGRRHAGDHRAVVPAGLVVSADHRCAAVLLLRGLPAQRHEPAGAGHLAAAAGDRGRTCRTAPARERPAPPGRQPGRRRDGVSPRSAAVAPERGGAAPAGLE